MKIELEKLQRLRNVWTEFNSGEFKESCINIQSSGHGVSKITYAPKRKRVRPRKFNCSRTLFKQSSPEYSLPPSMNQLMIGPIYAGLSQLSQAETSLNEAVWIVSSEEEVDYHPSPMLVSSQESIAIQPKSTDEPALSSPSSSEETEPTPLISGTMDNMENLDRIKFCNDMGHIDHFGAYCGMCEYMYRE